MFLLLWEQILLDDGSRAIVGDSSSESDVSKRIGPERRREGELLHCEAIKGVLHAHTIDMLLFRYNV